MLFDAFNILFIIILGYLYSRCMFLMKLASIILMLGGWVKAGGCDLVSGLAESVSEIRHGYVDLNNEELEAQYTAYQSRLQDIPNLTMATYPDRFGLCQRLASFIHDIENIFGIFAYRLESDSFAILIGRQRSLDWTGLDWTLVDWTGKDCQQHRQQ